MGPNLQKLSLCSCCTDRPWGKTFDSCRCAAVSLASRRAGAGSSCQSVGKRSCLSCESAGGCWQQLSKCRKAQLSLLQVGGQVLAAAVKVQQYGCGPCQAIPTDVHKCVRLSETSALRCCMLSPQANWSAHRRQLMQRVQKPSAPQPQSSRQVPVAQLHRRLPRAWNAGHRRHRHPMPATAHACSTAAGVRAGQWKGNAGSYCTH